MGLIFDAGTDRTRFTSGGYERPVQEALAGIVRPGDVVLRRRRKPGVLLSAAWPTDRTNRLRRGVRACTGQCCQNRAECTAEWSAKHPGLQDCRVTQ